MKKLILYTLCLAIFIACKKKNDPAPVNTGGGGGITTGNPSSGNGSGTTNYDVVFEAIRISFKTSGSFSSPYGSNRAFLAAQTVSNEVHYNYLSMGTVSLNNTIFSKF